MIVRPGQVWRSSLTQYHVLATYGEHVWALRMISGVSAVRQPKGPENYTRDFFLDNSRVKLHIDLGGDA